MLSRRGGGGLDGGLAGRRTGKAAFCGSWTGLSPGPTKCSGVAFRVDFKRGLFGQSVGPEHGLGATSEKSSEGLVGPHRGSLGRREGLGGRGRKGVSNGLVAGAHKMRWGLLSGPRSFVFEAFRAET